MAPSPPLASAPPLTPCPPAAQLAATGLRCQIVVPDGPELVRAEARFAKPLSLMDADSVSFGALTGTRLNGLQQIGKRLFGGGGDERPTARRDADVYLVVNASTSELVSFEAFVAEVVPPAATVVAFNLEARARRPAPPGARPRLFPAFPRISRGAHPPRSWRRRAATWACPASPAKPCTTASSAASPPPSSCASAPTPKP